MTLAGRLQPMPAPYDSPRVSGRRGKTDLDELSRANLNPKRRAARVLHGPRERASRDTEGRQATCLGIPHASPDKEIAGKTVAEVLNLAHDATGIVLIQERAVLGVLRENEGPG